MWPFRKDSRLDPSSIDSFRRLRDLPDKEAAFSGVVNLLVEKNPPCNSALVKAPPPDRRLTEPQNVLISIALLYLQVENGGLLQLFWNCPGRMEHISESLRTIGLDGMADELDRAAEKLGERFDDYERLRSRPDVAEAFAEAAKIFNFDWFDEMYFGDFDRGKLVKPGSNQTLYHFALEYVDANLNGFIRDAS